MCVFSAPVDRVANTKIFVAVKPGVDETADWMKVMGAEPGMAKPKPVGARQLVVYGNTVDLKRNDRVAMILPVPCDAKEIELEPGIQKWGKQLFEECEKAFVVPTFGFGGLPALGSEPVYRSISLLPVVRSGAYDVSIAPTAADLARIDPEKLRVEPGVLATIQAEYGSGYSFLICQLEPNATTNVPIAYSHAALSNGTAFVPCLHVHANEPCAKVTGEFDHAIYVYGLKNPHFEVRRASLKNYQIWVQTDVARLPHAVQNMLSKNVKMCEGMTGAHQLARVKQQGGNRSLNGDLFVRASDETTPTLFDTKEWTRVNHEDLYPSIFGHKGSVQFGGVPAFDQFGRPLPAGISALRTEADQKAAEPPKDPPKDWVTLSAEQLRKASGVDDPWFKRRVQELGPEERNALGSFLEELECDDRGRT